MSTTDEELLELKLALDEFSVNIRELNEALSPAPPYRLGPPVEVKFARQSGEFGGFATVYGEVDQQDDVIYRGAYTETLRRRGAVRPLLWQHRPAEPIGVVTLTDNATGLWAEASLSLEVRRAREAAALIDAGATTGLSIGFRTVASIKGRPRRLTEIDLLEVSLVTFPAADNARVSMVKQADAQHELIIADLRRTLADFRLPRL